jgi:hypothetical protein
MLPFELALSKREVERLFGPDQAGSTWSVEEGLSAVVQWLKKSGF